MEFYQDLMDYFMAKV